MDRQLGLPGVAGEIGLGVDYEADQFWVAANAGTRFAPEIDLGEVRLDDQLQLRLGGGWIVDPQLGLSAELLANLTYATLGQDPAGQAGELLVTGWTRRDSGVEARLGVGTGLGAGIGAPRLRVVAGVGFRPPR